MIEKENIDSRNAIYEIVMKYMAGLQFESQNIDYSIASAIKAAYTHPTTLHDLHYRSSICDSLIK